MGTQELRNLITLLPLHTMDDQKEVPPPLGLPATSSNDAESSTQPATEDNTSEMAPSGKPRPHAPKRDVDLSSLLTFAEKTEMVAFVARVTDTMQKHLTQVFDSTGIEDNLGPTRISFWARLPSHLRDLSLVKPEKPERCPEVHSGNTQKENVKPSNRPTGTAPGTDNTVPNAGIMFDRTEEQNIGPRLQELKKEMLLHFKKWQTAVHKRVNDISVKRGPDQGGQSSGGPRRGPSSNNKGRRDGPRANTITLEADPALLRLYPPTPTSLCSLPAEKRCLLLHSLLLLVLSLEHYSAYSRVLLLHVASSLHVPLRILVEDEGRVARSLSETVKDISADELLQKKTEETKTARRWKVGLASAAGAALIGVTGGLAAPLVAAGIGSVLGSVGLGTTAAAGLLGAMAESGFLVGSLFGMYGARATGKAMEQYTKDVQDFAFIPLRGSIGEDSEIGRISPEHRRLRVVIGISGWLTNESDVINPWGALGQQTEVYALRWELEPLLKLGNALETVIKSAAWSAAKKEIIARTIFASLFQALWPLGLLKISKIIDNPWSVGMVRADKTGAVLADLIQNRAQGERGVSLIGYSLGARAIYACLMILAERRAFGLVENAIMMGTPAPSDPGVWCTMKSVVSGRLVNVYSENDYILGFLYRTGSYQFGVSGLQRIEGIDGVENVDVSAKVSGHLRYQYLVGSILQHIGWEDVDGQKVGEDEEMLAVVEQKNRERERKRDALELDVEAKKLEQEVKEKNDQEVIRTRIRKMKSRK